MDKEGRLERGSGVEIEAQGGRSGHGGVGKCSLRQEQTGHAEWAVCEEERPRVWASGLNRSKQAFVSSLGSKEGDI